MIDEDRHMKILLQFLILSLNTVDGLRDSAKPFLNYALHQQAKGTQNLRRLYEAKDYEIENLNRENFQILSETTGKKFNMLKIRMKLSFIAFVRNQTITEMFLHTILNSYNILNRKGLIKNPWPKMDKQLINRILCNEGDAHKYDEKKDEKNKNKRLSNSSSDSSGLEELMGKNKERQKLDHY